MKIASYVSMDIFVKILLLQKMTIGGTKALLFKG